MADDISWTSHPPRLIYEYLLHGERGLSDVADRIHRRAHRQPGGKFAKADVRYLPFRPFPLLLWDNRCGRCRFWQEGGPGEAGGCHVVGRESDRYGGEAVHPDGWCGLYTPPENEPAFSWIRDRIEPSGATDVRGEYEPEMTRKEQRRESGHRSGTRVPVEAGGSSVAPGESSASGRDGGTTGSDDA